MSQANPYLIVVPPGVLSALAVTQLAAEDFFAKRAYDAAKRGDVRAASEEERITNTIKMARTSRMGSGLRFQEPGKPRFNLPAVIARPASV